MKKSTPLVSIIMLTWNGLDYTKQCLDSLKTNTVHPYELIMVDNASTDGTIEYLNNLEKQFPDNKVKLILNKSNNGFGPANNQGIEIAKGDIILFLNNDVVLTKGWLKNLICHFDEECTIGAVGPMTNSCRGDQLVSPKPYKALDEMGKYAQKRARDYAKQFQTYDRLVGFCLAVTRTALKETGGFDERFEIGNYEDEDLCLRIAQKGYKLGIALDVFIHHWGSITFKTNDIDYQGLKKDNQERFIKKWGHIRYVLLRLKNSKSLKQWVKRVKDIF